MLHWDLEHFVVLTKAAGNAFEINDPGRGRRTVSAAELSKHFSGIAVEFSPSDDLQVHSRSKGMTLPDLVGGIAGLRKPALAVLALSFFVEALLLTQPLIIRYNIDFGFVNDDLSLVGYLCGVSVIVALGSSAITLVRDDAVLKAGAEINLKIARRLFAHSLSLPISFFEKRLTGDLVDRYRSVEIIEQFLVGELPVGLLDGLFTIVSLSIMFVISFPIALATSLIFALFVALRVSSMKRIRDAEEAVVFARALESGYLVESLQNILTIKVRASEADRQSTWLSRFVELTNAQHRLSKLQALNRCLKLVVSGLDVGIFLMVAFYQFHGSNAEIGTLFAILFYKTHFFVRSTALVERMVSVNTLRIHLDRLEDIARAQPERDIRPELGAPTQVPAPEARGAITFQGVSFRYSAFDPPILVETRLSIRPGEFVVLTGPSGTGKTTILKLALGLYAPDSGVVSVDGVSTATADIASFRRQFGVVMQDDQVLIGSIAQNVAFFDPDMDMARVEWCCVQACLHDDIVATPMGYMGRIGGNAAGLSGGQRQRLLIARALYHRPRFLLLDEGTANLDREREAVILRNLKALGVTTLIIAHGPGPLEVADRVLHLENRSIQELDRSALGEDAFP